MKKWISLLAAALLLVSVIASGLAETADETADLLVVGAGPAGLSAAVSAVENGAEKDIVIEKTGKTGGNLNVTSGTLVGADTIIQREDGLLEDSVDMLYQDMIDTGSEHGGRPNSNLLYKYSELVGPAVDWLWENGLKDCEFTTDEEGHKAVFAPEHKLYSYPRSYKPKPIDSERYKSATHEVLDKLVASFRHSEKLQKHVAFLYAKGSVYHIENGCLLYHGAVPLTDEGEFAAETFEGHSLRGRALLDYCDLRARLGYFAPEGSPERQSGQDFLWYLWCGKLSPLFGRSAMTTFERLYIEDPETHKEIKDPYYTWYDDAAICCRILAEFGLTANCHIVNGHVPVREKAGESPIKGGGRLLVIDGGFCRAYHERTGIAGYTLVYSSHGMSLRTHQPFENTAKAVQENLDILSRVDVVDDNHTDRVLVEHMDEGANLYAQVADLHRLISAYRTGLIKEQPTKDTIW